MTSHHRLTPGEVPTTKLGEDVLEEVWEALAPYLTVEPDKGDAARMRLANILLDLARDGQRGTLDIMRAAAQLMRERDDSPDKSA